MSRPAWLPRVPRGLRRLTALGGLLLLCYALLGFLAAPALIRARLPGQVRRHLGLEAQVGKVRTNPFTLSVTMEEVRILDPAGDLLLGWERLYVNLQAATFVSRCLTFKTVDLTGLQGRLAVAPDGRLNISDLLRRLPSSPEAAPSPEPSRALRIDRLTVRDARLALLDRSPRQPFDTILGPMTFELEGFRTEAGRRTPYAFSGRTEAGERFTWTGTLTAEPLASEGTFTLEQIPLAKYAPYYRDRVAFEVASGRATLRAGYRFAWSEERHLLALQDGRLDLRDLRLTSPGAARPALEVPELDLRGLQADLLVRKVAIAAITLKAGRLDVQRRPDGGINLVDLFTPRPGPPEAPPASPLDLRVGDVRLRGFHLAFEDQSNPRPVRFTALDLDLGLRDLTLESNASVPLELSARLEGGGGLTAQGRATLQKPGFDLAVRLDGIALPAFDPYLEPALDVRLTRGTLSAEGRLRLGHPGASADALAYQGNLILARLEAMDGTQQEPFLRYRALGFKGLDFRAHPGALQVREVTLLEPEHRLVVARDGSTNVARALKLAAGAPSGAAAPPTPDRPFRLHFGRIDIQKGRLAFIDRSLEPNAALLLSHLQGSYTGLSTEPETASALELTGRVGALAPLHIRGRALPLRHDQDTDVAITVQGSELSDFGPYAGKYLGYTIRKGKLDLEARLRIARRQLDAQVKTRLDQFFLGDRTGSPEATRLPVKLALAILRDRKGVIDLDLPIAGSLDDPEFRYGRIVWKALLNVLGKVATSPFTLLGKLFASPGQDLSAVAFAPGAWEPDETARKTLAALSRALTERPELNLEVEGTADPDADRAALQKAGLERLLRRTKARTEGLAPDEVQVEPEARAHWLAVAHAAAFPSPSPARPDAAPAPPPPAEMEARLLETIRVEPSDLRHLADRRAKAVTALLAGEGGVPPARIFEVQGGELARQGGGARVHFSLK